MLAFLLGMGYNMNCHNGICGAFLFKEPKRQPHKLSIYGQSPRNLGETPYRCDRRAGSLSCGDFVMKKTTCKNCGREMPIRNPLAAVAIKTISKPLCKECRGRVGKK